MTTTINYLPPIWHQKKLKSCTAIVVCDLAYCHFQKQGMELTTPFSPLFLYYNTRRLIHKENVNRTIDIEYAFDAVTKYGLCLEEDWQYEIRKYRQMPPLQVYEKALAYRHFEFESLRQSLSDLKKSLAENRPFLFGLRLFPDNSWHFKMGETAKTGKMILPKFYHRHNANHAVLAVAYNETTRMFTVRNSMGTNWGNQGHFELPAEYLLNMNGAFAFYRIKI